MSDLLFTILKVFFHLIKAATNVLGSLFDFYFHGPVLSNHSSYNLGVAITAISIITGFVTFIYSNRELKFRLRDGERKIALIFSFLSIIFTFAGELGGVIMPYPFIFEIIGAGMMILSIILYTHVILGSIKKLSRHKILILKGILSATLSNAHLEKPQTIKGCIEIFELLLEKSLTDKDAQSIFRFDFSGRVMLDQFSESYFVLGSTLQFYRKHKKEGKYRLEYLEIFLKRLLSTSLENQESFLNVFVEEKIFPDSLFCFDEIMETEHDHRILEVLFGDYRFRGLSNVAQLSYIALVDRYFRLIYEENNHSSLPDNYQKNKEFNEELIKIFFKQIEEFFKSSFEQDHIEKLFDKVKDFSWHYRYGLKTNDKSESIRKRTGLFLYNILHDMIGRYEMGDGEVFRIKIIDLYTDFLEMDIGEDGSNNFAYQQFITKLKAKIIGGEDVIFPNYKGYFPAMVLVYFYMFGFFIFSDTHSESDVNQLHIPILSILAEAFPKLYSGFKQEFYDAESLPENKKALLEKQGREIIEKFLKKNMVYNFEENSLTNYSRNKAHGSKIYLNQIKSEKKIVVEKI